MIIIKGDTLTHVDSSTDIIEHYGVKGMRWGKHRANMKKVRQEQKSRVKKLKSDIKGLNDKGMKKLDKEAHRYARGGTKNVSKQLKKNERRLFAPFETEAYSNGYGTMVTDKYNPLLKRN